MELRLNEPDFLLSVVQMIRSLKRKRERSFFPPTVFYKERKERRRGLWAIPMAMIVKIHQCYKYFS